MASWHFSGPYGTPMGDLQTAVQAVSASATYLVVYQFGGSFYISYLL